MAHRRPPQEWLKAAVGLELAPSLLGGLGSVTGLPGNRGIISAPGGVGRVGGVRCTGACALVAHAAQLRGGSLTFDAPWGPVRQGGGLYPSLQRASGGRGRGAPSARSRW